ncbi:MAG: proton-conducting transporter membrane subunit [Chloroflexi bacterium]|nr:proton-conducting transporter membrane subunit [Chloroflexota bacterium]
MNLNSAFLALIAIPFLAAPILYLIGRLSIRKHRLWGMSLARILMLVVLLLEMVLLILNLKYAMSVGQVLLTVGEVTLSLDGIGLLLAAAVLLLGFFVTLFSIPYMGRENGEEKFYSLLMITIGSIVGLGMSNDLFNLWIWFEAMSISSYLLVAFYNEQPSSLEAGIKYLVQSAIGSALVLFGIAILFSITGSTSFEAILQNGGQVGLLGILGGGLLVVGFGVKTAMVPLHTWLPDAHSQAPSGISAMLSGVVIEAGLVAMLRSISIMGKFGENWGLLLVGFGCLNIFVGNLLALRQTQVKRLLAYSSLAQVGYMLLGFGFSFAFMIDDGAMGGFFHLITHSLMKGLAFLAAGALLYALHLSKGEHSPLTLEDLNGASKKYPVVAIGLSAALLGLGGLPPFAGFMSKWQILSAGVQTRDTVMIVVVVFAALNSVLSLAYYTPLINRMFRREPSEAVLGGKSISWMMILPIVILTIAILVIGVWPNAVRFLTENAAYGILIPYFN